MKNILDALTKYGNFLNWSTDHQGIRRVWLEPGSDTPDAYNGFELANDALIKFHSRKPDLIQYRWIDKNPNSVTCGVPYPWTDIEESQVANIEYYISKGNHYEIRRLYDIK